MENFNRSRTSAKRIGIREVPKGIGEPVWTQPKKFQTGILGEKMSVLMEFAIFPIGKGESVGDYVAEVVGLIKNGGYFYQLTPMGTIVEVERVEEATELLNRVSTLLEKSCNRLYLVAKMDIRKGKGNRMVGKINSVEQKLKGNGQKLEKAGEIKTIGQIGLDGQGVSKKN